MKPSFLRRNRRWVLAALLVPALTFNPMNPFLHVSAQTAPAPSGMANPAASDIDKETGKPIVTTPSGLKYVDLALGSGPTIKPGDYVRVKYVGKFTDGTVFDASEKHPPGTYEYQQGSPNLIAGWTEGSSTMKAGGKRKLIIPPSLGYGADGNDSIPPNSTLIFEIEVVLVSPTPTAPIPTL
jgi:FKBP-type peptidyl-prolyl cis-trans isomerase